MILTMRMGMLMSVCSSPVVALCLSVISPYRLVWVQVHENAWSGCAMGVHHPFSLPLHLVMVVIGCADQVHWQACAGAPPPIALCILQTHDKGTLCGCLWIPIRFLLDS